MLTHYNKFLGFLISSIFLLSITIAAPQSAPKMPPVVINSMLAKIVNWQPKIEATGTLVAAEGITLQPDMSGHITKIYFKSGQYVQQGAPLVQIYPDILAAQLQQNEADLQLAELNYQRYLTLSKQQAIAKSAFDQVASTYKKAQATVAETKSKLEQTLITAPFSGYLGISKVSLGDYLSAGQPIVNLENTNPIYVDFAIPEVYAKKAVVGQKVVISAKAYGNKRFVGKVIATESLINPSTQMLEVRASIPNQDNYLIPGSFVVVKLFIDKPQSIISLPQTAIAYSDQGAFVYKIVDDKAYQTFVKLGRRTQNAVFVLSGLKNGDEVVTAGQEKLFNGAAVQIQKPAG